MPFRLFLAEQRGCQTFTPCRYGSSRSESAGSWRTSKSAFEPFFTLSGECDFYEVG
jgi:hypothetical protein